jgi:hypothetical protein
MVEIHPAHMVKVESYTICFTSSYQGWIHFIYPGIYLRAYPNDNKIIKPFLENVIHESVECGRCVGEPKRHHQEFIRAIPCVTNSLFFIPFRNSNLVIS